MQLFSDASRQEFVERFGDARQLIGGLVDEFQSHVTNPGVEPILQVAAGFLSFRPEDGVAAADVGHYGMRTARGIAEGDPMFLARASAIAVAGSGGKKSAEDAMLGVEDGQMLVGDHFQS